VKLVFEREHDRRQARGLDLERQHASRDDPVGVGLVLDELGTRAAQHLAAQRIGDDQLGARVARVVVGVWIATRPSSGPPTSRAIV
jgi:hypothetical protein